MIKLSCSSCGAKLELTDDIDRFVCLHCGTEWLVNRSGGIASLKPVEEKLARLEKKTDKVVENTEIIADQIRMNKIANRIAVLQTKKQSVDLNPKMENPEWINLYKQYCKEKFIYNNKYGNYSVWIMLTGFSLFTLTLICLYLFNRFNQFLNYASENMHIALPLSFFYFLFCFLVGFVIFLPALLKIPPAPEDLSQSIPRYVQDPERTAAGVALVREIDDEIHALALKYGRMDQKI
ncbi:MAG: zinc ribbon domain-containing protein [Firmicutes bacterium]|nr:zinc ribbon domain-containing protein [Bacillota bacterium]